MGSRRRLIATLVTATAVSTLSAELMRHGRLALQAGEAERGLEAAQLAQFVLHGDAQERLLKKCMEAAREMERRRVGGERRGGQGWDASR